MASDPVFKAEKLASVYAWRQAHPEHDNAYKRDYAARNPEKVRAIARRWRRKHLKKAKDVRKAWLEKHPGYSTIRRKSALGRVCDSCGEDDSKRLWSVSWADYC